MSEGFGSGIKVLVVDDDDSIRLLFGELLGGEGFAVQLAPNIAEADAQLAKERFDLVITDKNLPDGFGLDLARRLLDGDGDTAVIAMSAYASVDSAVEAIQLNVADYFVKPLERLDAVLARVRRVVEHQALKRRNVELVDELRRKNRELESLAIRDALTGLFNHAFLQESLDKEISRSNRHGHTFALIFVDLDRFKAINDSLGHPAGDAVLKALAEILRGGRLSDVGFRLREQDIAARYGGDEFVLILPETDKNGAAMKAEVLRHGIEAARLHDGVQKLTISAGVSAYPADGETRDRLIHAADTALYAAKALGRNRIVTYSPGLSTLSSDHGPAGQAEAQQLLALDRTINQRLFNFVFQPIVESKTHAVFAYEGLCRPTDPVFPDPGTLIHAAERAGRISDLGRVLREGVVAAIPNLPSPGLLFVNLHPHELYDPHLTEVEPFLKPWANRIVFEVTETAAIADYGRVHDILARLKAHGFRVALDDLGSGYSGLNALALLEPDFVKLDIGLLQGIRSASRHSRLLRHILDYAEGEGVKVIAEGIESDREREIVTELGCPLLQGYYFGRPSATFAPVTGRVAQAPP
jgi:diguanylate cyclase (GGDEF)-like protein